MATTIITKNGSGAPLSGNLVEGELAIDLTNKQLYTKSGTSVIKLGNSGDAGQWEQNGDDIYYDAGNVLVGTDKSLTSAELSAGETGIALRSAPLIIASRDGGAPILLNRNISEGDIAIFRQNNAVVGSINSIPGDKIAFYGSGGSGVVVDASGRVGIGTDSPREPLHVVGSNSQDGVVKVGGDASTLGLDIGYVQAGQTEAQILMNPGYPNANAKMTLRVDGTRSVTQNQLVLEGNGYVGIGGTPGTRSALEIAREAKDTLARWKSAFDERLKAEPKADKKAVTLEITDDEFDTFPTEETLVEKLTARDIGGGNAKLQVAGGGYFSSSIKIGEYQNVGGGSIFTDHQLFNDGASNGSGIIFGGNTAPKAIIACNHTGAPIGSQIDLGSSAVAWKNGYFSGTVNADSFVDANGPIVSAFSMVNAFRKIQNAVSDETTVEGIKESLTNVLGGLIEEFEAMQSAATQEVTGE